MNISKEANKAGARGVVQKSMGLVWLAWMIPGECGEHPGSMRENVLFGRDSILQARLLCLPSRV